MFHFLVWLLTTVPIDSCELVFYKYLIILLCAKIFFFFETMFIYRIKFFF